MMMKKTNDCVKKNNRAPENSMILTGFGTVDYCDSYRIKKSVGENIEEITNRIFKLPKWVNRLLKTRDLLVKPFGLKTTKDTESGKLFPIIAQNENEIIMGINDRHLNFRVSILTNNEKSSICLTTIVHYNNVWGKVYFSFIKPFHKIIVHAMMRRLGKMIYFS
ncbi:MAG: DUF2867 domain-containing protein [Tannerellaceae bacterium]|jgi:hypothetical protein|nr:DUF2867 domain-containing protein [Tannerellaceae bacterium]